MTLWTLALVLAIAGAVHADPPGVTLSPDGTLTKDGKPVRAFGVNYFSLFYRTLQNPADTTYEAGLATLAERGIPFVRFMCSGFWPSENQLYMDDREQYFRRLDAVVKAAENHGIGLVPSMFWALSNVPDLVGEPCNQWGNPQSKTIAFMRTYVREVVTRYKDSPAIWGWEFGNEYNLGADLPNATEWRPAVWPTLGTAASRSERDDMTHDMVRSAFAEFAKAVRQYDPYRFITTGNGFPRTSAWHQRAEKSWTTDTPAQYVEMLLGDTPDPVNVISVHAYGEVERIKPTWDIAKGAKKGLFVGEFGVAKARSPETEKQFADLLGEIERCQIPLAALWVYDFGDQDQEWNVTAANARSWQLAAITEANKRIRASQPK